MGRGGGSAAAWLVGMAVVVQWIILAEGSATYVVGDAQGWGFQVPYARWAAGKPFRAGDTLVFNYVPGTHNVVPVNANGYRSCRASGGARALTSGRDRVTLGRGISYYICTFPGHCAAGMKIAIKAA